MAMALSPPAFIPLGCGFIIATVSQEGFNPRLAIMPM